MSLITAIKQYIKQLWEDSPSTNTALEAMRLNHMEDGIDNNDTRIVALENAPKAHKIINKTGTEMTERPNLQFTGIADVSDNNPSDKTVINIPSSLSAYTNDVGFITSTVNNLTNYYLKSETYTQAEVNALISGVIGLNILVVQTLPTQDISTTTIYLVPKQTPETQDVYDEYIYVNNAWEHIGSTQIDLSNYYTKTETDNLLGNKVDKVAGKQLSTEDFTSALKSKLESIASGAEVNVQPDWSQSDNTQDDYIKNKPQNLVTDANYVHTDNNYSTAEKNKLSGIATGAEVNVQSDWNQTDNTADDFIKNKPNIPSGQIQSDWNQSDNTAVDYIKNKPTIPTKVSDLQNDSGFITGVDVDDIGDVDLSNLANGQVLKYNSTSQKWENANESGGGGSYTAGDGINISQQDAISVDTAFTEASTRANIESGDTLATIWGKIKKFFSDLKAVAFSGSYDDLSNKPTIPVGSDYVLKSGDTMTGQLTVNREGEAYVRSFNSTKGLGVYLDSDSDGGHGIWSNGYNNGSFVTNGKWIIKRMPNGSLYSDAGDYVIDRRTGGSDTPFIIKSASSGTYIGFYDKNDSVLGYIGINSSHEPYFYFGGGKKIILNPDIVRGELTLNFLSSSTLRNTFNIPSDITDPVIVVTEHTFSNVGSSVVYHFIATKISGFSSIMISASTSSGSFSSSSTITVYYMVMQKS